MVEYTTYEEFIINELKKYVPVREYDLNDWKIIIKRVEEVEEGIFKYSLSSMDLYFDDEMYILEYGNTHIINGEVYYDFSSDTDCSGTYVKIGEVNY